MLDILFGWRKASKCKKLIRRVQCRLKLLKNKRSCVVKQLRQDVAELLKHGHEQTALDRVEQIFKDEALVEVYDLLGHFCEFIIINLPHIRKHKDCPNDISEAASTLIFSSARFGELPELLTIRKLFGERYGQNFIAVALELSPGNLVNNQIKESLYIKDVPDDVKYRMLDEIASTCNEPGPLLLEYKPFWQEEQAINSWSNRISSREVSMEHQNGGLEIQVSNPTEAELGKILHVDLSSEIKKVPKEMDNNGMMMGEESSSENSAKLPQEMVYLDDIEEIVSPVIEDGINAKDQRMFVFKTFKMPFRKEQIDDINDESTPDEELHEKSESRSSRRTRKASSRKRTRRRRSLSSENRRVTDVECVMYYGESDETSPDHDKRISHYRKQRRNKSSVEDSRKSYNATGKDGRNSNADTVDKFSLDNPCYNHCSKDEKSQCWIPKMKSSKIVHSLVEEKIQYGLEFHKDSCGGEKEENAAAGHDQETPQKPYLRAMSTVYTARPNEDNLDNIIRSKSFPLEQPRNRHSSCRHIHPKLPDYDELAEKFMALKRENLQKLNRQSGAIHDHQKN